MRIAVYGMGYVGLTAAACLSSSGHDVIGVEVSETKVADLNAGKCPITEPGLDELIAKGVQSGKLKAVQQAGALLATCDLAIVCVGTPSAPDGSHNMGYIAEVTRQIASTVNSDRKKPLTVVYRSTIRPGSIDELISPIFKESLGANFSNAIEIVYNPEFLRESTAIQDYFNPPKIVVGTVDGEPSVNVDEMYKGIPGPVFYTKFREAEFTKFVDNTWHAVKVSFANEIGRACTKLGISSKKIHEIFVSDTKLNISAYYMRPGGPFGGSCLPKDVRALQYIAADVGAHTPLVDSLLRSNDAHKHFLFEHCVANVEPQARVLMVGLAFKANSDDLRESPNVDLARKLLQSGYKLSVYDPGLEPSKLVGQNLGYAYTQLPTLTGLLISKDQVEAETWDLVIDAVGALKDMPVRTKKIVSTHSLP